MAKESFKQTARIGLFEKVPIEGFQHNFNSNCVGTLEVECLVEIDLKEIESLCARAGRNKSQRARQGPVAVRVLNRKLVSGRYPRKKEDAHQ